jgi:hypothetical protein
VNLPGFNFIGNESAPASPSNSNQNQNEEDENTEPTDPQASPGPSAGQAPPSQVTPVRSPVRRPDGFLEADAVPAQSAPAPLLSLSQLNKEF